MKLREKTIEIPRSKPRSEENMCFLFSLLAQARELNDAVGNRGKVFFNYARTEMIEYD
jgi:hypothetical protein